MRKFLFASSLIFSFVYAHANVSARAEGRRLIVNEVPVITFAEDNHGLDGEAKAKRIAELLGNADGKAVRVERRGATSIIFAGSAPLMTIEPWEAKGYGVSAYALANTWAKPLRAAMALPPIKLETISMRLGPNGSASVCITGSAVGSAEVSSSDPDIAIASRTGGRLTVRSIKPGLAQVFLTAPDAKESLRVRVLPYAAELPQSVHASVTGAPATVETVRGAIRSALLAQVRKVPGTRLRYAIDWATSVPTGEARTFEIKVKASGPDSVPSEGRVTATIQNAPIDSLPDGELWFCNRPEKVTGPGQFFSATLKPDLPVRMLYHHYNASGSELILRVTAVNSSDKPADILLIPGDSDPTRNPALAGMRAADQFARNWVCHSAEIVRIAPRSTLPITLRRLYQTQTMSGLCSMRLLPGGPENLTITASAASPFSMDDAWRDALRSSTPWREVGCQPIDPKFEVALRQSELIYGKPFLDKEFAYRVGDAASIIRLGSEEIVRHGTGEKLGGNYGVMYNLRTTLDNPTKQAVDVELMFRASGGYSGGVFLIDGNVVKTPLLNPNQEVCVGTFKVQAGLRRFLMIQTLPLSGSSYPATISLRSVPAVASLLAYGKGVKAPVSASSKQ